MDTVVVDNVVDFVEQAQKERKKMTVELKENLLHQLLAARCPVGITTLKTGAQRAILYCEHYSDLDDAVNELIKENKVTLHFIDEDELYLSANHD